MITLTIDDKPVEAKEGMTVLEAAKEADLLVLSSFIKVKAYQGTVSLSKKHETFIQKLLRSQLVVSSFGICKNFQSIGKRKCFRFVIS